MVLHQAFGRLTAAADAPVVQPDSVFLLASITKPVTACAAVAPLAARRVCAVFYHPRLFLRVRLAQACGGDLQTLRKSSGMRPSSTLVSVAMAPGSTVTSQTLPFAAGAGSTAFSSCGLAVS